MCREADALECRAFILIKDSFIHRGILPVFHKKNVPPETRSFKSLQSSKIARYAWCDTNNFFLLERFSSERLNNASFFHLKRYKNVFIPWIIKRKMVKEWRIKNTAKMNRNVNNKVTTLSALYNRYPFVARDTTWAANSAKLSGCRRHARCWLTIASRS